MCGVKGALSSAGRGFADKPSILPAKPITMSGLRAQRERENSYPLPISRSSSNNLSLSWLSCSIFRPASERSCFSRSTSCWALVYLPCHRSSSSIRCSRSCSSSSSRSSCFSVRSRHSCY